MLALDSSEQATGQVGRKRTIMTLPTFWTCKDWRKLIGQDKEVIEEAERTKIDLLCSLKRTREEKGGLSLIEISQVIKDALPPEELGQIIKNLK